MKRQKDEKWLDELISHTINTTKPQFDVEKWKQKYPDEFQMLLSRAAQRPLTPSARQPNIWRTILKSPITKLAAAAVIIAGIGLYAILVHQGPGEQAVPKVVKSPTKMMTAMSLTMAYRRGGIEAVDEQCEKAIRMLGPRPLRLTIGQLFKDTNG